MNHQTTSDTPETDALYKNDHRPNLIEHARKLERERDEARNEIIGWRNKWDCAIEMGARAECERDEMTLRRNLAISLLDEECALADRLAKGIELFLSQTVSPLAPLKVPLDAWKEARNV